MRHDLFHLLVHLAPVSTVFHVNEIDNDDAPDVPEPKLPGDLRAGFQIGLVHRFLVPLGARVSSRIHVYRHQRLCGLDEYVSAILQPYFPVQRLADLVFDPVGVEHRRRPIVHVNARAELGGYPLEICKDLLVYRLRIDDHTVDIGREQIAYHPRRHFDVLVDHGGGRCIPDLFLDIPRDPGQLLEIVLQLGIRFAQCGCPHDDPEVVGLEAPGQVPEPALFVPVVDTSRHADVIGMGNQHEKPARQRYLGGDPRSLGADRLLRNLDYNFLAFFDHLLYPVFPVPAPAGSGILVLVVIEIDPVGPSGDIRRLQECRLVHADIDESCLNTRYDRRYNALADIPDHAFVFRAFDQKLNEMVVLEHGNARFVRGRLNYDIFPQIKTFCLAPGEPVKVNVPKW